MSFLPGGPEALAAFQNQRRVTFADDGRGFLGLCLKGAALLLVTFGFYRFWLAVDIRRFLWSRTELAEEPLEYTGTGGELFLGFIMALAILAPIVGLVTLAGYLAEELAPFASLASSLFFILFSQFALYRARRYRLSRTVWRGARLWADGSGWSYAFRWLGWSFLTSLTLGLAYPWMRASLERYKLDHTLYGSARAGFEGTGGALFRQYWTLWLAGVLIFLIVGGGAVGFGLLASSRFSVLERSLIGGLASLALLVVFLLFAILILPIWKAREWRWWAQGARLEGARLSCDLKATDFLRVYFKWIGALILANIAIGAVVALVAFGLHAASIAPQLKGSFSIWHVAVLFGYLAVILGYGVIQRYFLTYGLWRTYVRSLTIQGVDTLENIAALGTPASALGEGLADSLDIGAM